jgi:hypothetical protein
MLPILIFRFFPTMDGPAHLYNSNLVKELILNSNSPLSDFYQLNSDPVPNWLSHFILTTGRFIFPAWLSEKILLILYFTLLPLSFRALIKVYNKPYLSYIIFPFTYSFLFYIGFYNFCMAFIFLFYSIRYWLLYDEQRKFKNAAILFSLITLCFFAHIVVYSFLLFSLFLLITLPFITQKTGNKSISVAQLVKKYLFLFFAAVPSLILFIKFVLSKNMTFNNDFVETNELIKWIKDIRPIIALVYNPELRLTEVLYHLFIGLTAILLYRRIQQIKFEESLTFKEKVINAIRNGFFIKADIFLFISIVTLFFYFNVPSGSGAGMMSERFCHIFYIFFITWLAMQPLTRGLWIFSMIIIIGINFGFVYRYTLATIGFNRDAVLIYNTAQYIKPYSTVIPINHSDNWLGIHFSNYLGCEKPLVILENYEADVGWFPVKWNDNKMPVITLGSMKKNDACLYWRSSQNELNTQMADYVFIYGTNQDTSECGNSVTNMLARYYNKVYESENKVVKLYGVKIKSEFKE